MNETMLGNWVNDHLAKEARQTDPRAVKESEFCTYANMFCDTAHLQAWEEGSSLMGRALDLAGAAALGRDGRAVFPRIDPSL